jgi:cbb3-type cytochrome oxidase cytochrome c subunit
MSNAPQKLIDAIRDVEQADREMKAVIYAPGVSLSSERAKAARKKLKEAKAAQKEAKKEFDAYNAAEKKKLDSYIKMLDESLAKGKKAAKTAKAKKGGRRTRRRV